MNLELERLLAIVIDSKTASHNLLDGVLEPERLLREPDAISVLTPKQATKLKACLRLAELLSESSNLEHIYGPEVGAQYLMPKLRYLNHEEFWLLTLNSKNRLTGAFRISIGTLTTSAVHAREVFSRAIANKAAAVMVAHNHPSGDPHPSADDDRVTEALKKAGEYLLMPLLDHIVIGNGTYYSYQENGRM